MRLITHNMLRCNIKGMQNGKVRYIKQFNQWKEYNRIIKYIKKRLLYNYALSKQIKRPALIIVDLKGEDCILCQITSKQRDDEHTIPLPNKDVIEGKLNVDSYVRLNKIATLEKSLIRYKIGTISNNKLSEVKDKIISMVKSG